LAAGRPVLESEHEYEYEYEYEHPHEDGDEHVREDEHACVFAL
jgi:hypothetical protein